MLFSVVSNASRQTPGDGPCSKLFPSTHQQYFTNVFAAKDACGTTVRIQRTRKAMVVDTLSNHQFTLSSTTLPAPKYRRKGSTPHDARQTPAAIDRRQKSCSGMAHKSRQGKTQVGLPDNTYSRSALDGSGIRREQASPIEQVICRPRLSAGRYSSVLSDVRRSSGRRAPLSRTRSFANGSRQVQLIVTAKLQPYRECIKAARRREQTRPANSRNAVNGIMQRQLTYRCLFSEKIMSHGNTRHKSRILQRPDRSCSRNFAASGGNNIVLPARCRFKMVAAHWLQKPENGGSPAKMPQYHCTTARKTMPSQYRR